MLDFVEKVVALFVDATNRVGRFVDASADAAGAAFVVVESCLP